MLTYFDYFIPLLIAHLVCFLSRLKRKYPFEEPRSVVVESRDFKAQVDRLGGIINVFADLVERQKERVVPVVNIAQYLSYFETNVCLSYFLTTETFLLLLVNLS